MCLHRCFLLSLSVSFFLIGVAVAFPAHANTGYVCGDGVLQVGELCDNGANNSDSVPNACRTDCRLPYCGDNVLDSGEECDDGHVNSNNPNSCRPNCRLPVCGDGVRDDSSHSLREFNEECDDGDSDESNGCKTDCTACLRLTGNIETTTNIKLCRDVFEVGDYGDEGVIIVKYPGITIDCDGATLQGTGIGAGIFVKMCNDVMVKNCTISGYAAGIKAVQSQNLRIQLDGNNFSNNDESIVLEDSTKITFYSEKASTALSPRLEAVTVAPVNARKSTHPQAITVPSQTARTQSPSTPAEPQTITSSPPTMKSDTSRTMVSPPIPRGRIVLKNQRTYLDVNVAVSRIDIYTGERRLARLKGNKHLDISPYVSRASQGELIIHYIDSRGIKTVQKIKVPTARK